MLCGRALELGQKVVVPISLVAAIPGDYTGPASRAYRYSTDEQTVRVDPLRVTITPVGKQRFWFAREQGTVDAGDPEIRLGGRGDRDSTGPPSS